MPKKIRLGILGGGGDSLIGVLHRVASFINDNYEITGAVFNPDHEQSLAFAREIDVPTDRIYKDFDTFVAEEMKLPAEERIQVVSVLTPNFLHFPMAHKLLENGFHVICEKPMTTTLEEARQLQAAQEKSGSIFGLTHTYTGYPMTRQIRKMIEGGMLGNIQKVDAKYYQGWINDLIHDKEKRTTTWRLDPAKSGASCCNGDIGVHAFNMIEFTTGLRINDILCDMNSLYDDNPMDIDATTLVRFEGSKAKGVIRASQIATGEETNLSIAIYGDKGGIKWEQENPNFVYYFPESGPMQVYKPGHAYNSELSLNGTKLPPGHPEGIFAAMANIYLGVAKAVRGEAYDAGEFPTMTDGVRGMDFIEKSVASNQQGNIWVSLES
jgi:predicted dehydrogenase